MMRYDLTHIQPWIATGSRVLDLGCGDGEFLQQLTRDKGVHGTGLENDLPNIIAAAARGINVIQQDMDKGLDNFADDSYDTVVLAHALQVLHNPHRVLADMVRIGKDAIVTFPNFGHWRCRTYLGLRGRMPVSNMLPYSWYDTPNIHFCTIKDFESLCASLAIKITDHAIVAGKWETTLAKVAPNVFATTAIYRIRRCES